MKNLFDVETLHVTSLHPSQKPAGSDCQSPVLERNRQIIILELSAFDRLPAELGR